MKTKEQIQEIENIKENMCYLDVLNLSLDPEMDGMRLWIFWDKDNKKVEYRHYTKQTYPNPNPDTVFHMIDCDWNDQDASYFSNGWAIRKDEYIGKMEKELDIASSSMSKEELEEKEKEIDILREKEFDYYDEDKKEYISESEMVSRSISLGDFSDWEEKFWEDFDRKHGR
ncbi:MAG: hypothetical protein OQK69_02825 [Gammaproteobacteria bacterium]|nr:hypothetical protein [Gammaproteobacteria bacterium]